MDGTIRQTEIRWLYCFACAEPFELLGLRGTCPCGRSVARLDGGVLELQGPVRGLAPADNVVRVEGGEWVPIPEELTITRRVAHAA